MSIKSMLEKLEEMKRDPEQAKLLEVPTELYPGRFDLEQFKESLRIAGRAKR